MARTAVGSADQPDPDPTDLYTAYRLAWQQRMRSVRQVLAAAGRFDSRRRTAR